MRKETIEEDRTGCIQWEGTEGTRDHQNMKHKWHIENGTAIRLASIKSAFGASWNFRECSPRQTGRRPDQLPSSRQLLRLSPSKRYPSSQRYVTSPPKSKSVPVRWPLEGIPGSPQTSPIGRVRERERESGLEGWSSYQQMCYECVKLSALYCNTLDQMSGVRSNRESNSVARTHSMLQPNVPLWWPCCYRNAYHGNRIWQLLSRKLKI